MIVIVDLLDEKELQNQQFLPVNIDNYSELTLDDLKDIYNVNDITALSEDVKYTVNGYDIKTKIKENFVNYKGPMELWQNKPKLVIEYGRTQEVSESTQGEEAASFYIKKAVYSVVLIRVGV